MAPINTKNVHHFLGTNFLYDEMMVAGLGDIGKAAAEMIAKFNPLSRDKGPKPGEGQVARNGKADSMTSCLSRRRRAKMNFASP